MADLLPELRAAQIEQRFLQCRVAHDHAFHGNRLGAQVGQVQFVYDVITSVDPNDRGRRRPAAFQRLTEWRASRSRFTHSPSSWFDS
jgi:hypothetical protein